MAHDAYLSGCDLSRANWSGANLLNARLRKVCLEQTDLSASNLHGLASDSVHGNGVRLEQALMTRCRLKECLNHA
ncbi:Pentapeptide repeats (8 copies) [compost metagenome]